MAAPMTLDISDLKELFNGKLILCRCEKGRPVAVACVMPNNLKNADMLDTYADYLTDMHHDCGQIATSYMVFEVVA